MFRSSLLLFLLFLVSCDDGDLQIETIDFNSANIEFCESITDLSSTFFFKLNPNEALILELQSGILKNEVSDGAITSTVPGQSQVSYRTFSDDVSTNYFCDQVPPATPVVIEEIIAEGGEVLVTTIQSESDTTIYEHTIELQDITLVNSRGERITNLSIDQFGTIVTIEE
ncbi:MAG: hypothetical protein ABF293_05910 [Flavobacteriaceae bacterium]